MSLYIFDKYLFPLSQAKVTTRFGVPCSWQYLIAADSSVPVEEPAKIPSFLTNSRAARKLSSSGIEYDPVTREKSAIFGTKSSPIPSTNQEPAVPTLWSRI